MSVQKYFNDKSDFYINDYNIRQIYCNLFFFLFGLEIQRDNLIGFGLTSQFLFFLVYLNFELS